MRQGVGEHPSRQQPAVKRAARGGAWGGGRLAMHGSPCMRALPGPICDDDHLMTEREGGQSEKRGWQGGVGPCSLLTLSLDWSVAFVLLRLEHSLKPSSSGAEPGAPFLWEAAAMCVCGGWDWMGRGGPTRKQHCHQASPARVLRASVSARQAFDEAFLREHRMASSRPGRALAGTRAPPGVRNRAARSMSIHQLARAPV